MSPNLDLVHSIYADFEGRVALRVYAQAMRRDEDEQSKLRLGGVVEFMSIEADEVPWSSTTG